MPSVDVDKVIPADDMELLEDVDLDVSTKPDADVEDEKPVDDEEVVDKDEEIKDDEDEEVEDKDEDKEKAVVEDELGPRRPTFKEIKEKYPDLFKTFPALRDAFFRESEYTKVFPTIEDAREAAEDLGILSTIRDKLIAGDATTLFESTKEADPRSYAKLVRGVLPALYKMDQDAYAQAITPPIENLLRTALREGKANGNEDLENSARHISQWFFGTDDVALGKTTTVKKEDTESPEAQRLQKERTEFEARKYNEAYQTVIADRDAYMERVVLKGLDPDDELSPYIRKTLVRDIITEVDRVLLKDKAHLSLMNSKWRRAKTEGFSKDSLSSIVSAYQARAKSLVPSIRAKLKSAALGKAGDVKNTRRSEEIQDRSKKELPVGRPGVTRDRLPSPRDIDWRATSDADILDGKIKTRK
jgi:hypothetical protein